jgi:hypothetical protein
MANKKINELDSRATLTLSDLMAVGDPSTGYLYKTTISDLKTLTGAGVVSFNGRFGSVVPAEGDYSLTQLSDVIITSASNNQVLQYNGSNWVNATIDLSGYVPYTGATANVNLGTFDLTADIVILNQVRAVGSGGISFNSNNGTQIAVLGGGGAANMTLYGGLAGTGANFSSSVSTDAGYAFKILASGTLFQNGYSVLSSLAGNFSITQAISAGNLKAVTFDFSAWATNTSRTYTLPDANGTLALTSDLSGYVTLATAQTISGVKTFGSSVSINTGGQADLSIVSSTGNSSNINSYVAGVLKSTISTSATEFKLISAIGNVLKFQSSANFIASLIFNNAADYSYTFPAASGTLALTSDLGSYVTLGTFQTITANKSFSGWIKTDDGIFLSNSAAVSSSTGFGKLSYNKSGTVSTFRITNENNATASLVFDNTTNYSYTFPAVSGTVALTSNLSAYVPYTGATGSLFLGSNDVESRFVMIEGDGTLGGILSFKQYASSWQSTTDHTNIYATGSNKLNFSFFQTGGGGKFFNFDVSSLGSTGRTYTMPDASGTLALTSNLSAYLPLAGGTLTGKIAGVNLEFSNPSATFVSGGVNNSTSTHIIAVPSGSTWSNGASFSANNNAQFLNFGGSQSIQNGAIVAGTVNVNRISFTAGSSTVTMAQSTGIRAMAGMQMLQQTGGTINGTVSHGASMLVQGVYPTNSANITFTNYYGVLINPLDEWGGVTFGSRYGIYQAGSSDANFFAGASTFSSSVTANAFSATSAGNANVFNSASATTGWLQIAMNNTSGSAILGIESSTAGTTTNGSLAYATILRNYTATALQFATNNVVRTTIDASGNVGIGTNSPYALLTVYSGTAGDRILIDSSTGSGSNGAIAWGAGGTPNISARIRGIDDGFYGTHLLFETRGNSGPATTTTERMRITSGGNVLIGTTTNVAGYRASIEGISGSLFWLTNGSANSQIFLTSTNNFYITNANSQGVVLNNGATSWSAYSDERLKNINGKIENALESLLTLRAVNYSWKSDNTNKENLGLIAQDIEKVFPQIIDKSKIHNSDDETEYLNVKYTELIPVLVKAIQELNAQIKTLKNN